MKVLHVVAGMDPKEGGVTEAVRSIITGTLSHGLLNEVVCLDSAGAPYLTANPFTIYAMGPSKTAWRYSRKLLPWLKQHISSYDVVIVHGLWQYHVFAVMKAWRSSSSKRPRLLVMPHGMLDPYFQKASGRKLKAIRNWLFWKFNEAAAINKSDGLLFTCETEMMLAGQSFRPYKPSKQYVVGLGIEGGAERVTDPARERFYQKCKGVNVKGALLYISRIHPKKGTDLLIKAYLDLKKELPALPKLIIAGPGLESDFGVEIQKLAAEDPAVIFTGMLVGEEKWVAFEQAAAMILPSHQENFGFVVAEALSAGRPVLISNQVNIWREVSAGGAGFVEKDTIAGVTKLLRNWNSVSDEEAIAMQVRAAHTFEKYFSLDSSTDKMLNALLQTVGNSHKAN